MNGVERRNHRLRSFTLRALIIGVSVTAVVLSLVAYRLNRYRQQGAALSIIQQSGGRPQLTTSDGTVLTHPTRYAASFSSLLIGDPSVVVSTVDLSNPVLAEDTSRSLMPSLKRLIPGARYGHISLDVCGNPHISGELVEEMRANLPNCRFVEYTPVPKVVTHAVKRGMIQREVRMAIGALLYQQRTDWVGDKASIIDMLGSIHERYTTPDGLESWTYFTDDVGVGVFGIDFDADKTVSAMWSGRGSPPIYRQLTPLSSLGYGRDPRRGRQVARIRTHVVEHRQHECRASACLEKLPYPGRISGSN